MGLPILRPHTAKADVASTRTQVGHQALHAKSAGGY